MCQYAVYCALLLCLLVYTIMIVVLLCSLSINLMRLNKIILNDLSNNCEFDMTARYIDKTWLQLKKKF